MDKEMMNLQQQSDALNCVAYIHGVFEVAGIFGSVSGNTGKANYFAFGDADVPAMAGTFLDLMAAHPEYEKLQAPVVLMMAWTRTGMVHGGAPGPDMRLAYEKGDEIQSECEMQRIPDGTLTVEQSADLVICQAYIRGIMEMLTTFDSIRHEKPVHYDFIDGVDGAQATEVFLNYLAANPSMKNDPAVLVLTLAWLSGNVLYSTDMKSDTPAPKPAPKSQYRKSDCGQGKS